MSVWYFTKNFNRDEKLKLLGKLNHLPAYNADQACLQHQKTHNALSPEVFYNTIANVLYLSSSNRPFFKWVYGLNTFQQRSGILVSMSLFRENSKHAFRVNFLLSIFVLALQMAQELVRVDDLHLKVWFCMKPPKSSKYVHICTCIYIYIHMHTEYCKGLRGFW